MSTPGPLVSRGEDTFEEARVDRVFNRRLPDRQPAAVVRPETEAEVVAAVSLARERGWQVAVRSGGHSWAQWSVRDDALVIDLGGLRDGGRMMQFPGGPLAALNLVVFD